MPWFYRPTPTIGKSCLLALVLKKASLHAADYLRKKYNNDSANIDPISPTPTSKQTTVMMY